MGCGASVPSWESRHVGFWPSLTMKLVWDHWTEQPQKLSLRVVDDKLAERMVLRGGCGAARGRGSGATNAIIKASDSRKCATLQAEKQLQGKKHVWSLERYVRSGGDRKAVWVSSQEEGGVLPKRISLNCSGGRVSTHGVVNPQITTLRAQRPPTRLVAMTCWGLFLPLHTFQRMQTWPRTGTCSRWASLALSPSS